MSPEASPADIHANVFCHISVRIRIRIRIRICILIRIRIRIHIRIRDSSLEASPADTR